MSEHLDSKFDLVQLLEHARGSGDAGGFDTQGLERASQGVEFGVDQAEEGLGAANVLGDEEDRRAGGGLDRRRDELSLQPECSLPRVVGT